LVIFIRAPPTMESATGDTLISVPAPATTDSTDTDGQWITTEEQLRKVADTMVSKATTPEERRVAITRMDKVTRFFQETLMKLPPPTKVAKPKLKLNMDLSKVLTEDQLREMAGAVINLCKTPEARHAAAAQLMQISALLLAPDSRKRGASPDVDSGVDATPSEPDQKRASLSPSPPPPPPADV
jgi:hypothetical protein